MDENKWSSTIIRHQERTIREKYETFYSGTVPKIVKRSNVASKVKQNEIAITPKTVGERNVTKKYR